MDKWAKLLRINRPLTYLRLYLWRGVAQLYKWRLDTKESTKQAGGRLNKTVSGHKGIRLFTLKYCMLFLNSNDSKNDSSDNLKEVALGNLAGVVRPSGESNI